MIRTIQCLFWILLITLVLFSVTPLIAQVDRGTIGGLVKDPSGAVIPGATVKIIRIDTNSTYDLVTNGEGLYIAPNLPVGTYRVIIQSAGFSTFSREPIEVRAQVEVRVDAALQIGALTEVSTVTADAPLLDVSATSNSSALPSTTVEKLPLIVSVYQRSITDLLQNLPGFTSGDSFVPRGSGGSAGDTEVFLDGAPASEWGIARGGFSEISPLIEQVGEFSVVANGFNAEYGGFGNWFTNVTIKSGTNTIHGSVFDHLGNSALNAKDYFATEVTPFRQNEGGFTLGGPVIIPKVYNGRDRTFFFGSLGLFYSRMGASGDLITVPSLKERAGDFSEIGVPIYDPTTQVVNPDGSITRSQFANNVIPPTRITNAARQVMAFVPPPDLPGVNNNYHSRANAKWPYLNAYTPLIKVDHALSTKQKLSVMYNKRLNHRIIWQGQGRIPFPEWGKPQTNPIDEDLDQLANSWKLRLNHDYIISNALVNHFTFSVDNYFNRGANKTMNQGWNQKLGIQGIPADDGSFPAVSFSGGIDTPTGFGINYDENWLEYRYGFNENLTWIHGKHAMKYGFSIGLNNEDRRFGTQSGSFTFSNASTASVPNASDGSSFASFLLGAVHSASATIGLATQLRFRQYAIFAQDEWRATKNLTISYGLRWDYSPPMYEVNDYMTSFEPNIPNPGAGGLPGALAYAGTGPGKIGGQFQDPWRKGFGPRLGIAYQLNDKTIIRASSGIIFSNSGNGQPFLTTGALGYSGTAAFNSADGFTPVYYLDTQSFPQSFKKPPLIDPTFLNGQAISYIPRYADRLPQIVNWSLVIQRELIPNLALEVSYLGSRSTHLAIGGIATNLNYLPADKLSLGFLLLQPINSPLAIGAGFHEPFPGFANQQGANTVAQALKPYPQYTYVLSDVALLPIGKASYHSLQVKATRRFSQGLSGLFFFTWAKSLTNANGGSTTYAIFAEGLRQYPGSNPTTIDPGVPAAIFGLNLSYDLPFGKGKRFLASAPRLVDSILGGWSVTGFMRYVSGAPLQITAFNFFNSTLGYGFPPPLNGIPFMNANYNAGQSVYGKTDFSNWDYINDRYLNSAAFSGPAAFTFGNTARYLDWVRGPWTKSESLSISKAIAFSERFKFHLGADFVNPFNIVRWGAPSTLAGLPTFGQITSTQGNARQIQINMKLDF
jgi:hypothetical protein